MKKEAFELIIPLLLLLLLFIIHFNLRFEAEEGTANGQQVIYRYEEKEFPKFTGRGYFGFGTEANNIKLTLKVWCES